MTEKETAHKAKVGKTQAQTPPNPTDALKQRHQNTEDRLKAEEEVRQQQASEAEERRDAALKREEAMRR